MALSYLTDGDAPRDFRVSTSESDGHYTKCLLCYTVKRNFYCEECIRTGSFVHSSMPYSDRFSEKQLKLLRMKVNRKHILERCEKLLANKLKQDKLLTEAKLSRDRVDLIHLAIEQRKSNIDKKKKELDNIKKHNTELKQKLPRYEKRVSSLSKHAEMQRMELHNKMNLYNDQAEILASLRRSRIRQLITYIFPVYVTYDTSDSLEDMEFIYGDVAPRPRIHIVAPWTYEDADVADLQSIVQDAKDDISAAPDNAAQRTVAAIALAAQVTALLAWITDLRLPYTLSLDEYWMSRASGAEFARGVRCAGAGAAALCVGLALPPPAPAPPAPALRLLQAHVPSLGRVEGWVGAALAATAAGWQARHAAAPAEPEPEHLSWPAHEQLEEVSESPPASQVPSYVASFASMWRGWTK